ncbi:hypothetical protein SDC9_187712 [bioreactor metagenome]|uniref:Uncharacterized protein n=1 Tax=bioreactor metagenome TaxID=1076179 RepID=A0A645HNM6_9ZZZZ
MLPDEAAKRLAIVCFLADDGYSAVAHCANIDMPLGKPFHCLVKIPLGCRNAEIHLFSKIRHRQYVGFFHAEDATDHLVPSLIKVGDKPT